ncbi:MULTISPECIES: hypothetical protein [Pseudomonas]|uniref:Uncharacterized protein n=1 Tax=Pseudomonas monteilii TaxID=76759 RepID=A0A2N1IVT9_9PSED|nr:MULTISPECIES: hypothetical protein [Pseudomonas putida group]CAI3808196.1 hypothetical protein DBADOPDK_04928 [Pseudomonas sp. MM223]CAI3808557.1 hypothetical protein GLGCALEP_05052 [Pseudomonas sp. MM221]PKI24863.1 hypothetical protein CXB65_06160 [Pseudomonas monteilii]POF93143.1 hypothetical protein BGP83_10725 [Pseudomonas putida]RPD93737.1 hypothetical protein EGN69_12520 [Pseudomonas monteilii]
MIPEQEAPREDGVPALARLRESLPDVVGMVGFGLLARGLWVGFGEAVSLSVCGAILMALSAYAVIRGGN